MRPSLLDSVRSCQHCTDLPLGAKPILQFSSNAKILIAGQAPGRKTHEQGIPFDDASGHRLRRWLGVTREEFYSADLFAILPMAFCYPGTGAAGDIAPPSICAERWRDQLMAELNEINMTLILGRYALDWHLAGSKGVSVTKAVQSWQADWPTKIVLPHPSPRNNRWLKQNPWFEQRLIPRLQRRIRQSIESVRH